MKQHNSLEELLKAYRKVYSHRTIEEQLNNKDLIDDFLKSNSLAAEQEADWVSIKDKLPTEHNVVILYDIESENYGCEFVHKYDLTTNRYTRNWTHWKPFKSPCL